jgi:hypothetical protein
MHFEEYILLSYIDSYNMNGNVILRYSELLPCAIILKGSKTCFRLK